MFLAAGVATAASVVVAAATATPPTSDDRKAIVFVYGCDGLVAEGGVLPDPQYEPSPSGAQNHNFVLSREKVRFSDRFSKPLYEVDVWGSGVDDAGHKFTVHARGMRGNVDVWSGGTATVRRNDGSYASGTASYAGYQPMAPLWTQNNGLAVAADDCRIKG